MSGRCWDTSSQMPSSNPLTHVPKYWPAGRRIFLASHSSSVFFLAKKKSRSITLSEVKTIQSMRRFFSHLKHRELVRFLTAHLIRFQGMRLETLEDCASPPGIKAASFGPICQICQVKLDAVPRDLNDLEVRLSLRCRVASELPVVSDESPTFHNQKDT